MELQYEVFSSIIGKSYQKWYDCNGYLIRSDDEYFNYDSEERLISTTWKEFIGSQEVYEAFFKMDFEYKQKSESWYKYKIGTIDLGESCLASYENRDPIIEDDSKLIHIRESIYDENKRVILIKQFDIENSVIEETFLTYIDGVYRSYKTLTNDIQTEEKIHHYKEDYLYKITQCFSPIDKTQTNKSIEIFYDINGFETSRNYLFKIGMNTYETNIELTHDENKKTAIFLNVIFDVFSCNEVMSLPHDAYYPDLGLYRDITCNFKIVFNYMAKRIVSLYLYNNDDNSILEVLNFFEDSICNPLTQTLSHKIISGVRYFENSMEKQFTHILHY